MCECHVVDSDHDDAIAAIHKARHLVMMGNPEAALSLLPRLILYFAGRKDADGTAKTNVQIGHAHAALEEWREAIGAFRRAARRLKGVDRLECLSWLAWCCRQRDDTRRAYWYDRLSLRLARSIGSGLYEMRALYGLALDAPPTEWVALDYLNQCLRLAECAGDREMAGVCQHNLVRAHNQLGLYSEARRHMDLALRYPRAGEEKAALLCEMIVTLTEIGDIEAARSYLRQARTFTPARSPWLMKARVHEAKGRFLQKLGRRRGAAQMLQKAAGEFKMANRYWDSQTMLAEAAHLKEGN
jgi:tetratricopeptide (TPR) repeat protein